jgi:hypothetical protein
MQIFQSVGSRLPELVEGVCTGLFSKLQGPRSSSLFLENHGRVRMMNRMEEA